MVKRKLVVSSGNQNKIKEIKDIFQGLPIEVVSKNDLGFSDLNVVEDGKTLEENSLIKARALGEKIDYMVLADDSGLFVDVLEGEPGVHSSRYAGEDGNDDKNNEKLLQALKDIPLEKRTAKFRTVIVLITEDKEIIPVHGECKGRIGLEKQGDNGFGYDPLFIPDGYNGSFAVLGDDIKNKISHRAKALEGLKNEIVKLIKDEINEDSNNI